MSAELGPYGSIIVPAWNEATVIARGLRALYADVDPGALDVVVACNGCTDGTEAVVRDTGLPVTLLELPPVGKVGAIRAAEKATSVLPRLYLDADVELTGPAACAVLKLLAGSAVAARPPFEYLVAGASWPVRQFYAVRGELPGIASDLCGAGVYGLSATARARFDEFPALIGDDLFAARIVSPEEVVIAACDPVKVRVPATVGALVRTLARVSRGNRELATVRPDLAPSTASATGRDLARLARDPRRWPGVAVYVTLVVVGRLLSRRSSSGWERDHTARVGAS